MIRHRLFVGLLFFVLCACAGRPTAVTPTAEPTRPPATPTLTASPIPTSTPATAEPARPEEAILILEPGPGSRLTSPIRVAGVADPTFEQTLVVRLVSADGAELALVPAQIEADMGQRGPFAIDVPFTVSGEEQAFIQVYTTSARDGGVTHLSAVGVTLADSGSAAVVPVTLQPERIAVAQPVLGATVSGGVARVEGFGLAGFEQTLVIEVQDEAGAVVGSQPVIVAAPDLGQPGPFSADVPYVVTTGGPGRIAVRDISPAFGGDVHVSSVEITLQP
jgi:hypothetical protein